MDRAGGKFFSNFAMQEGTFDIDAFTISTFANLEQHLYETANGQLPVTLVMSGAVCIESPIRSERWQCGHGDTLGYAGSGVRPAVTAAHALEVSESRGEVLVHPLEKLLPQCRVRPGRAGAAPREECQPHTQRHVQLRHTVLARCPVP